MNANQITIGLRQSSKRLPKTAIATTALVLWALSLYLPVFEEAGAGRGNLISGFWVLIFACTWGICVGVGIPSAAMNIGVTVHVPESSEGADSWAKWACIAAVK